MIRLENVSKTFTDSNKEVHAVNNVSLTINDGDIFGIIGFSGAGKSTLVRCINLLEKPTDGKVFVDDAEITALSGKELRKARKKIGMIFQHFNLMPSRTIFGNVAYPLHGSGLSKEEIKEKVHHLLELVGISEKENAFPSQLSGGQKQRVAIARALANDPNILLCDEATSALDPQTTKSILKLLQQLNQTLGITVVVITHEMAVVKEICNRVAIIEHGELVENGLVEDIFSHPKSKAARELILRDVPENSGKAEGAVAAQMERIQGDKKLRIVFTENSAFEPVIANMILQFGKPVNILRADTKNVGGVAKGEMILGLPDDRHLQIDMEQYLTEHGLEIEEVTGDVE